MLPQPVDVAVMQPENRVARRRVGIGHPSALATDRSVDGVMGLRFESAMRPSLVDRPASPLPAKTAAGARGGNEVDGPHRLRIDRCARRERYSGIARGAPSRCVQRVG